MPTTKPKTLGDYLSARLQAALQKDRNAPTPGARGLPVVPGVRNSGQADRPLENVLDQATDIRADIPRVDPVVVV